MKFLVKMLFSFNFHAGFSCTTKTKMSIDSLIKKIIQFMEEECFIHKNKNSKTLTLRVMKTGSFK